MAGIGQNTFRTPLFQSNGGFAQRICSVDHIVHNQTGSALNIADDVHDFRHIGFWAAFIDDCQVGIQGFCHGAGADDTADIRADDGQIFNPLLLDVVQQNRGGINIIHRNIEEALNLVGMQIDSQNTVDPCRIQHICYQFGRNRNADGTRTAVLARIAEIRNSCRDAACRSTFERIRHCQDFHQVVIGRCASRLKDKDIATAYVFQQLDGNFTV